MHQDYDRIRYAKIVSKEAVFKFYEPDIVEGYCKECPNYNELWSCPPHSFTADSYLESYNFVLLVGEKIFRNEHSQSKTPMSSYFQEVRRVIGDELIELSETNDVEVLIAGNCYMCDECQRTKGKNCKYENKMKYSLESIGFMVGNIAKKLLGIELEWPKSGEDATSLMTVGAVFAKDDILLKAIIEKWR